MPQKRNNISYINEEREESVYDISMHTSLSYTMLSHIKEMKEKYFSENEIEKAILMYNILKYEIEKYM